MSDIPPDELFHSLSSLPEPGLVVDILSRLPVKSLLRFRSISESWRALIDSQYFIKKHINHSIETETNFNIVYRSFNRLCTASFGSLLMLKPLENPLFSDKSETTILGSCNGVLCLSSTLRVLSLSPTIMTINKETALLNPSTRKFKKIPIPPVNFRQDSIRRYWVEGFGYDCVNGDYKVVRVVQSIQDNILDSDISVYSLKLGLWRGIRGFPYYLVHPTSHSVFASGCLHWVVRRKLEPNGNFVIVAFDLASEKYRIVPLPEYASQCFKMHMGVVSGFLYVCLYRDGGVDIWMMESYGVEGSWNKLISISSANKSFDLVRLLSCSMRTGKVLMEEDNKRLVWYDIKTKTFESVLESRDLFLADVYVGSLVQLNGSSDSGSDEKKQQTKEENEEEYKGR